MNLYHISMKNDTDLDWLIIAATPEQARDLWIARIQSFLDDPEIGFEGPVVATAPTKGNYIIIRHAPVLDMTKAAAVEWELMVFYYVAETPHSMSARIAKLKKMRQ